MAHVAVESQLAPTAHEVADAKEANDPSLHLMDGVISQERVHARYQM